MLAAYAPEGVTKALIDCMLVWLDAVDENFALVGDFRAETTVFSIFP